MLPNLGLRRYVRYTNILKNTRILYSTIANDGDGTSVSKTGGFAKAYEKQTHILNQDRPKETFSSLLRNSKLMDVSYQLIIKYLLNHNIL